MSQFKKVIKNLTIIMLPLFIALIVSSNVTIANYDLIIPRWLFPLVWTILYLLMGYSSYLIYKETYKISRIYILQLLFNYIWVFIFFTFKNYLLAFIWIIILIILVIKMIKEFYQINKLSAYLQIPYLVWLIIATFLNLTYLL